MKKTILFDIGIYITLSYGFLSAAMNPSLQSYLSLLFWFSMGYFVLPAIINFIKKYNNS